MTAHEFIPIPTAPAGSRLSFMNAARDVAAALKEGRSADRFAETVGDLYLAGARKATSALHVYASIPAPLVFSDMVEREGAPKEAVEAFMERLDQVAADRMADAFPALREVVPPGAGAGVDVMRLACATLAESAARGRKALSGDADQDASAPERLLARVRGAVEAGVATQADRGQVALAAAAVAQAAEAAVTMSTPRERSVFGRQGQFDRALNAVAAVERHLGEGSSHLAARVRTIVAGEADAARAMRA